MRSKTNKVASAKKKRKTPNKLQPNLNKFSAEFKNKKKQQLSKWKLKEKSKPAVIMIEVWRRACDQEAIPLDVASKWFQQIMKRYVDHDARPYHNDKLLNFKINLLQSYSNVASHLVFAIFFQYYEFDVRDFGYVENCNAFNTFYKESGIDNQILLESVSQLLGDPQFNDQQTENDLLYFQDMDLAIFGASPDEYKMYASQLQREYVHLDDETYKSMRLKILQTFLTIPTIYSTEFFRNKFEAIARANIENEISELKK